MPVDMNKNTNWFSYPGIWSMYFIIVMLTWLLVLATAGCSVADAWIIVDCDPQPVVWTLSPSRDSFAQASRGFVAAWYRSMSLIRDCREWPTSATSGSRQDATGHSAWVDGRGSQQGRLPVLPWALQVTFYLFHCGQGFPFAPRTRAVTKQPHLVGAD